MSITQSKLTVNQVGTDSTVNYVTLQPTLTGLTNAVYASPQLGYVPNTNTLLVNGFTKANRILTLPESGENVTLGYINMPINSQSTGYTFVLADSGKLILHPSSDTVARTYTIPANSVVPFPPGTVLTIVNQNAAGSITITITTDTLRLAGTGATGTRTLAANGIATCIKITGTEWMISGTGIS